MTGVGVLTLDGEVRRVGPGTAIDIPIGAAHRIANRGPGDLVFIEVQHGTYFGEDDIERLDDDYGRSPVGTVGAAADAGRPNAQSRLGGSDL